MKSVASALVSAKYRQHGGEDKGWYVPLALLKLSSCLPPGETCGLYSVVKMYRCRSARWTTFGLARFIHLRDWTWWVMNAVHTGVLFEYESGAKFGRRHCGNYRLRSPCSTDACSLMPPDSLSRYSRRACW